MRVGGVLIVDRPLRPARLRPARTPALLCLRQALLGSLARDIGKARPTHVTGPNCLLCLLNASNFEMLVCLVYASQQRHARALRAVGQLRRTLARLLDGQSSSKRHLFAAVSFTSPQSYLEA